MCVCGCLVRRAVPACVCRTSTQPARPNAHTHKNSLPRSPSTTVHSSLGRLAGPQGLPPSSTTFVMLVSQITRCLCVSCQVPDLMQAVCACVCRQFSGSVCSRRPPCACCLWCLLASTTTDGSATRALFSHRKQACWCQKFVVLSLLGSRV